MYAVFSSVNEESSFIRLTKDRDTLIFRKCNCISLQRNQLHPLFRKKFPIPRRFHFFGGAGRTRDVETWNFCA